MAHSLDIQPRSGAQIAYTRTCQHSGCQNTATLRIQLNASYGPPDAWNVCQVHAADMMPGLLALVALTPPS